MRRRGSGSVTGSPGDLGGGKDARRHDKKVRYDVNGPSCVLSGNRTPNGMPRQTTGSPIQRVHRVNNKGKEGTECWGTLRFLRYWALTGY